MWCHTQLEHKIASSYLYFQGNYSSTESTTRTKLPWPPKIQIAKRVYSSNPLPLQPTLLRPWPMSIVVSMKSNDLSKRPCTHRQNSSRMWIDVAGWNERCRTMWWRWCQLKKVEVWCACRGLKAFASFLSLCLSFDGLSVGSRVMCISQWRREELVDRSGLECLVAMLKYRLSRRPWWMNDDCVPVASRALWTFQANWMIATRVDEIIMIRRLHYCVWGGAMYIDI